MTYPTLAEVERADREQLARWYRFLPSAPLDKLDIQARIFTRFTEMGMFTPELSKKIGWEQ